MEIDEKIRSQVVIKPDDDEPAAADLAALDPDDQPISLD